jgi:hypothetical protein
MSELNSKLNQLKVYRIESYVSDVMLQSMDVLITIVKIPNQLNLMLMNKTNISVKIVG